MIIPALTGQNLEWVELSDGIVVNEGGNLAMSVVFCAAMLRIVILTNLISQRRLRRKLR